MTSAKISLPQIKNIILVSSAKGGVGKSTISVGLALSLAKLNLKVSILDADIYGPNIPTILNCHCAPEVHEDKIYPVIHDKISYVSIASIFPPEEAFVVRSPILHKLLQEMLEKVYWPTLDYLIIDMPPGTGDVAISISNFLNPNYAILVSTPSALAVADLKRTISMYKKLNIKILGLITNMSHLNCPHCQMSITLWDESPLKQLGLELLGSVPLQLEFDIHSQLDVISKTIHTKILKGELL